ncbi:MAG: adenylate/guanylate cyclase domain-containing protein [Rubricoccaceae bacterium]
MPPAFKILFVDDEPDLAPLIRQRFRRQTRTGELELLFATDGLEALDVLGEHPDVEIVVTDINMPRMDGLTLLGRLAAERRRYKPIVVTAYGDMENIRTAMNRGAFDFLTKPIDLADLEITLEQAREAVAREREAERVRAAFGRYLSDGIARALLEAPDALTLGGEKRVVTVLMSDLTGFSAHAESLDPERVLELLNVYLGAMTDVVEAHGGTIDEFIGDAVLAIFGAPFRADDHAARAVACAVDMQRAMERVNAEMARRRLPRLDMVAAVNTGEVIVGNIGSEKRTKYGVVGSPVNLTARIQSVANPGEVLISDVTAEAVRASGVPLRLRTSREVEVKGFAQPVRVHPVASVGRHAVPVPNEPLRALAEPLPVAFCTVLCDQRSDDEARGEVVELSSTSALVRSSACADPGTEICLWFDLPALSGVHVYAHVLNGKAHPHPEGHPHSEGHMHPEGHMYLRFAALPAEAHEALEPLLRP